MPENNIGVPGAGEDGKQKTKLSRTIFFCVRGEAHF